MQVNLINTLAQPLKSTVQFIAHQEKASGLSTTRFIQDTSTCLAPKAVFSRSKADFAENAFLELSESFLVYFIPAILGEKVARKFFARKLENGAKKLVATPAVELLKKGGAINKKVLPVKAAIALTAMLIPLTEFTLNYFKNLFTLKVFKQGNFDNIADLNQTKETEEAHKKIRNSAHKNIKRAIAVFAGCLGLGALIAKRGANSKTLQDVSELILAPGTKLFKNSEKKRNFFNKYFSLDFASENGKLALSKGQLTSCVLVGGIGYFGASKDRGKQNFLETLFRFPVIGFYIITGSDLFEKGFKKILRKTGKCKELINEKLETPKFEKLEGLAKDLAKKNNTKVEAKFKKLAKQKALISGVPFVFGIGVMGFFVAGISNVFTRFRYNREQKQKNATKELLKPSQNERQTYKAFLK